MNIDQRGLPNVDVAIIGGGAAGTLVATHLLRVRESRLDVAIIDPSHELARGVAYSTERPEHLLNVIASRMSAFNDDPNHFVRYLSQQSYGTHSKCAELGASFVPRRVYGRYLLKTLQSQPRYASLRHFVDQAVDVDGEGVISLLSGERLRARKIVLALGNAPRGLPATAGDAGSRVANAWDYTAVGRIESEADVCILGSGLSMVDAVATLARGGHRGSIQVLSRHGLMPQPHAAPSSHDGSVGDLLALNLRGKLRDIRSRVEDGRRAGQPWQWTFDRLRSHGQSLWTSLGMREQRLFLRHLARYWDIHRHRIAPQVAAMLDELRATGQLKISAGRLLSAHERPDGGIIMQWQSRRTSETLSQRADWIINATGVETNIKSLPDPLLLALLRQGRIVSGPHHIGIASQGVGQVLNSNSQPDPAMLVVGAMRIGDLWESIAIPELRLQARQVAEFIRSTHG